MAISLGKRIHAAKAKATESPDVTIAGWVKSVRLVGKLAFVILRDRSGTIQLTFKTETPNFEALKTLQAESVIAAAGDVVKGKVKSGENELLVKEWTMLSPAETPLPIDVWGNTPTALDKRLDWRSVDLREPKNQTVFKIQSTLVYSAIDYLTKEGFTIVFTPSLMGVPSESGSEMFEVPYFKKKAFLRQDPQLHRQLTIIGGVEKLVDVGPSWRAELSHTHHHLCEHRTIAVEQAFVGDEQDVMRLEENLIVEMLKSVKKNCNEELKILGKEIIVPETPFPELRYPEIYDILAKLWKKITYGKEHDRESEGLLGQYVQKKYGHQFYWINRFPFAVKPFYVMRVDETPEWARSVDLMFKGIELSSGGQREHRYEKLMEQVREKGISPSSVEWFTKFFRYGAPPHGGFAIGVERITAQLLDLEDIREAVLFTRDPERLVP
ncbi:MAG: aspartate--tRNA(Asn) ligase [Candidatus Aenigmarchaeota archaeon]|nr:aspartate--tRNA(Asn) ligase [Candidatus Aenigmarchaeota archaeon]